MKKIKINKGMSVLLASMLVAGSIVIGCDSDTDTTEDNTTTQEQQVEIQEQEKAEDNNITFSLGSGMWKVGQDLKAGEYILVKNDGEYMGSFDITTGTSGDFDEIVDSNAFHNFEYIKVKDGQYLKLDGCTLYIIDEVKPSMHLEKFDELTNGMFIVGIDIEPGQYKLENINKEYNGWFSLYNSLDGGYNGGVDLQDSDFFENNTFITLTEGQYLKLDENTKIILNK